MHEALTKTQRWSSQRFADKRWGDFTLTRLTLIGALSCFGLALLLPEAGASSQESDYSFDWLDPDKKVYVLQNRKFTKAGSIQLSGLVGGAMTTYRNSMIVEPRLTYYLIEDLGIEAFFSYGLYDQENNAYGALSGTVGTSETRFNPVVRSIDTRSGLMVHWSPWYAKINVFNQILHFDWYWTAGLGQTRFRLDVRPRPDFPEEYVIQSAISGFIGTGHQFHLSRNWVFRLDVTSMIYGLPFLGQEGEQTWYSDFDFKAGLAFRF
jgi:outer membrane beta-barrel protein